MLNLAAVVMEGVAFLLNKNIIALRDLDVIRLK